MQNNLPLVSVVIPCYNHQDYVQDCIQSVIDQTYENIELIIIDDGSKDNSVSKIQEMVEACQKRFVRFEFRNNLNKGLTATLNEALDWITGDFYVAFASDDLMISDRIAKQVDILVKNIRYYACSGSQLKIDSKGNVLEQSKQNNIIKNNQEKDKSNIFLKPNNIYSPTTMFRRDVIIKLGGYNNEILIEDLYIFYKAAFENMIHYQVTDIFTKYRVHDTNNHKRYVWMYENKIKILDDLEKTYNKSELRELRKLRKLIYLESYYSLTRYSDKKIALKLFRNVIRYFYSPFFIIGTFYLFFRI